MSDPTAAARTLAPCHESDGSTTTFRPPKRQGLPVDRGPFSRTPGVAATVVAFDADAQTAAAAFGAGATAVISQSAARGNVASALVVAAAGSSKPDRFDLSERELEILDLRSEGLVPESRTPIAPP